jgi:hypothetical protein
MQECDIHSDTFRDVLLLSAIHPWTELHCQLGMRDFGRIIPVALVGQLREAPKAGMVIPVMLQSGLISEEVKSRLHRRFDHKQLTSFYLDDYEFLGRIVQMDYRNSPVNGRDEAEILTFVIAVYPNFLS